MEIFARSVPTAWGEYGNCGIGAEKNAEKICRQLILFATTELQRTDPRRYGLREQDHRMEKDKDQKPEKKKEPEQEVRDLPPKKDVKGGNSTEKRNGSTRTGEVDFMRDYE